jgi:DNA-binding CsgD family transcriptional regulator
MSQHDSRAGASQISDWVESDSPAGELDMVRLSAARARGMDEAGATIARQLNGPLTALLLYMGEIKQHSDQFARTTGDRDYLKQVVDNAVQQTERVCALIKQIGGAFEGAAAEPDGKGGRETRARDPNPKEAGRATGGMVAPEFRQKPLTRREREVLNLISQGYSNKQGALQMRISPRTFESHRAEAMRKLGARNTADLVRAALLHSID